MCRIFNTLSSVDDFLFLCYKQSSTMHLHVSLCRRQAPLIHTLDSLQIIETFCLLLIEFKVKGSTASLLFLVSVTTRRCLASLLRISLLMLHSTPVSFDVLSCSLLAFAFYTMSC